MTYYFPDLEPICCSMSSSNCCFLSCIQISQEAGQMVWYFHLFKNFSQFVVIHTIKGFGIVNKAEVDVFLEISFFFSDPLDVGNLISDSSAFSKSSLNILKFTVHVKSISCVQLFVTLWTVSLKPFCPWDSPGKNTGVCSHFLLQGIFPKRIESGSPALHVDSIPSEQPGNPPTILIHPYISLIQPDYICNACSNAIRPIK